eukprot:5733753-Pleurochrysis_carterae.AAC.1
MNAERAASVPTNVTSQTASLWHSRSKLGYALVVWERPSSVGMIREIYATDNSEWGFPAFGTQVWWLITLSSRTLHVPFLLPKVKLQCARWDGAHHRFVAPTPRKPPGLVSQPLCTSTPDAAVTADGGGAEAGRPRAVSGIAAAMLLCWHSL